MRFAGKIELTRTAVDLYELMEELVDFFTPGHDGSDLWYEYHTNESANPNTVLFHALGAWRIKPGMHDALWNPAFTVAAAQLFRPNW